jgi:hypothetical protein
VPELVGGDVGQPGILGDPGEHLSS